MTIAASRNIPEVITADHVGPGVRTYVHMHIRTYLRNYVRTYHECMHIQSTASIRP